MSPASLRAFVCIILASGGSSSIHGHFPVRSSRYASSETVSGGLRRRRRQHMTCNWTRKCRLYPPTTVLPASTQLLIDIRDRADFRAVRTHTLVYIQVDTHGWYALGKWHMIMSLFHATMSIYNKATSVYRCLVYDVRHAWYVNNVVGVWEGLVIILVNLYC